MIMPLMMFVGNLSYVAIAIVGGLRIISGQLTLGEVQAFIQYSRQFTQPLSQVASMATMLQSGVASAERVFELLDAEEQETETEQAGAANRIREGRVELEHVRFSYAPDREQIGRASCRERRRIPAAVLRLPPTLRTPVRYW